ncbi:hypothetical protein AAFC00_004845 [Neodothiora populina]|uniref:Exonuclease domain-containing protein n=1 Tax=Neodothiora populina TaxID=2781224 RepID=A0ABR3P4S0_9PEZI
MFSTTGLFKSIPCPEGESCAITACIFSHELRPKTSDKTAEAASLYEAGNDHDRKRRKLTDSSTESRSQESILKKNSDLPQTSSNGSYKGPMAKSDVTPISSTISSVTRKAPITLQRTVTPPILQKSTKPTTAAKSQPVSSKPVAKETLNPRKVARDPAGHAKRTLFLKYMHLEMSRLNEGVKKGGHPDKASLSLTDDELIKAALDEEENIANGNSTVYANIIKNRVAAYKKMKVDDWVKHVLTTFVKPAEEDTAPKKFEPLNTGLPLHQEYLFLDQFIADQSDLAKHGYVPIPPSENEMVEARAAVAASLNYEVCDRCKSRFRVFPDRREEDGALTTNGPCVHHWGRPAYPKRERVDAIKGGRETVYSCCGESLGTRGCTKLETHVFKINDAKRLASVLPFMNTPENTNPKKAPNGKVPAALTFDCEMGYTVCGFELMRLTAVTWPEGDPCIDVLVRPQGAILDFNTRFSGISPEAYGASIPYGVSSGLDSLLPSPPPGSEVAPIPAHIGDPMPIVDSPAAARDLLCSYITPLTPLIGHALENDLNVVRLCHPRIIDTVLLFPHPKGLPIRYGLKMLTKQRLDRDIQMGGANGHDSAEDARATGELVRFAVKKRWEDLKRDGFTIDNGRLMPPLPPDTQPSAKESRVLGGGAADVKRQRIQIHGEESGEGSAKRANIRD